MSWKSTEKKKDFTNDACNEHDKKTYKNALLGKTNQITLIREIPLKSAIKGLILASKISSLSDHGLRTPSFGLRCL